MFQCGENTKQIRKDPLPQMFIPCCLFQHFHIETAAGHIQKEKVIGFPYINSAWNPVELAFQGPDRIPGITEHFYEIVTGPAGNKIE